MIAQRIAQGREQRFTLKDAEQFASTTWLSGGETYTGEKVTVEGSLSLVPVFAAVNAISSSISVMPCHVYRRLEQGRERATDTWQYRLLHEAPNDEMTPGTFFETITLHLLLWGNAYLEKVKGTFAGARRVVELHPIQPSRVVVTRDRTGAKVFNIDGDQSKTYDESKILHIPALGYDGTTGISPIAKARQEIGSAISRQRHQGSVYQRGALLSGVLERPSTAPKWSEQGKTNFKDSWKRWFEGASNAGGTPILEDDMTFRPLSMPLKDQQFIEQGQFTTTQIATLFNMPASRINGQTGDSLTYGTREQDAIQYVVQTLLPWTNKIEQGLWRDNELFPSRTFYPALLPEALMRGDAASRVAFYEAMNKLKVLSSNDIAELEDRPVKPGGDEFPEITATPGGAGSDDDAQAG